MDAVMFVSLHIMAITICRGARGNSTLWLTAHTTIRLTGMLMEFQRATRKVRRVSREIGGHKSESFNPNYHSFTQINEFGHCITQCELSITPITLIVRNRPTVSLRVDPFSLSQLRKHKQNKQTGNNKTCLVLSVAAQNGRRGLFQE